MHNKNHKYVVGTMLKSMAVFKNKLVYDPDKRNDMQSDVKDNGKQKVYK